MTDTEKRQIGTIDMTPTWAGIMPALIAVLENGTETGKIAARAELMDLAASVDRSNAKIRELRAAGL